MFSFVCLSRQLSPLFFLQLLTLCCVSSLTKRLAHSQAALSQERAARQAAERHMHSLQEEMLRLRDQLAATERKLERYESESLAQQLAPPASSSANAATTPVASTFQPSASVVRIPSVSSETGANASASPTPSTARYVMEPSAVASTTGREQVPSASKQDNGHTITSLNTRHKHFTKLT